MMAQKRKGDGTTAQESNFSYYKEARQSLFDNLDDDTRAQYEAKAVEENLALKAPPNRDLIYESVLIFLD